MDAIRRLASLGEIMSNFLEGGGHMDSFILRLLLLLVEKGIVISFRVTKDKIYLIIKK